MVKRIIGISRALLVILFWVFFTIPAMLWAAMVAGWSLAWKEATEGTEKGWEELGKILKK